MYHKYFSVMSNFFCREQTYAYLAQTCLRYLLAVFLVVSASASDYEVKSMLGSKNMIIGLVIWDVVLSVLLIVVIVSLIAACTDIKNINRHRHKRFVRLMNFGYCLSAVYDLVTLVQLEMVRDIQRQLQPCDLFVVFEIDHLRFQGRV